MVSNGRRNNEHREQEPVMAYFKVQQHLSGRTEENHEKSLSGQPEFNTGPLKYKAGALIT
jgi:hypothetical protein